MIAHVGGVPLEEVLPSLIGGGTALGGGARLGCGAPAAGAR
jgi:hypothetical protein